MLCQNIMLVFCRKPPPQWSYRQCLGHRQCLSGRLTRLIYIWERPFLRKLRYPAEKARSLPPVVFFPPDSPEQKARVITYITDICAYTANACTAAYLDRGRAGKRRRPVAGCYQEKSVIWAIPNGGTRRLLVAFNRSS